MRQSTEFARNFLRAGRNAIATVKLNPWAKPGAYYSPLSTANDARNAVAWRDIEPVGVDLRKSQQLELATKLRAQWEDLPSGGRYRADNGQYSRADAFVLNSMLRHYRPQRVVEIGSGWSTAVILDAEVGAAVTCIEPHPERLLGALAGGGLESVTLVRAGVQEVPLDFFSALEPGDVLFIDSTHVVKPGSDVVWEYLHILPRLKPGVLVHVHDIFWPFEYPVEWLLERRDWTELYLLRALLTGSSSWQIELFSSWLWQVHPEQVPSNVRDGHPGSIWIRKIA